MAANGAPQPPRRRVIRDHVFRAEDRWGCSRTFADSTTISSARCRAALDDGMRSTATRRPPSSSASAPPTRVIGGGKITSAVSVPDLSAAPRPRALHAGNATCAHTLRSPPSISCFERHPLRGMKRQCIPRHPKRDGGRRAEESLRSRSCFALCSASCARERHAALSPGTGEAGVSRWDGRRHDAVTPCIRLPRTGRPTGCRVRQAAALRSRNPARAIHRADFRLRVSDATSQRRRFMPRDGCCCESALSRRGAGGYSPRRVPGR